MGIAIAEMEGEWQVYRQIGGIAPKPAHRRNDHYLFIFQETGRSKVLLDGVELTLSGQMILCISPGQVHETISASDDVNAWIITAGVNRVRYTDTFARFYFQYAGFTIDAALATYLSECFGLLYKIDPSLKEVRISLLDACIGMIATVYHHAIPPADVTSRRAEITSAFKALVLKHFKEMKSPADYAEQLHLTPAYLNEVVKDATGSPVSFWVQQAVITEAKRLLSGTERTIKEIAFSLGYMDQGYFTRYFTNAVGEAPLTFRTRNRK